MKRTLARAAYHLSVLICWIPLVVVVFFLFETLLPAGRGADGIYRGGDRLPLGMVTIGLTLAIADRLMSLLFYRAGVSERRWSIFRRG